MYKKNYDSLMFGRRALLFITLIFIYFMQLCYISWSEEDSVHRFSREYWENKEKTTEFIFEGKEWEKTFDKETKTLVFSVPCDMDLGMYQYVHIYLSSQEGYELRWGWSGKKWSEGIFFPSDGMNLIKKEEKGIEGL